MYNVLVPVDRDRDRGAHQARYVERLASADEDVAATVLVVVSADTFEETGDAAFDENPAAVEAANYLEETGVDVHRTVETGSASHAIVTTADDVEADEVVMGGRKRSGVALVLLGSTVHDVMVSTDRPVTVTGESARLGDGVRTVLVPVDRDAGRAVHQAEYVAGLPSAEGGVEATVMYVFPHQDYTGAPPHEFEEVDAAVEVADHLEAAGVKVERVAIGGEVTSKIVDAAEQRDVDGIVTAGRKRSGVQKVLLGSTAMDILLSAERPVTLTG